LMRPVPGRIASRFGPRYHPILHYSRMHTGVDFSGGTGTPVRAASTGEVFSASWRGGYGQCIILLHGGGMSTLYGHLSRIYVRPGQGVKRGQVIGAIGSTGLSTGPHLHFELRRNGAPVNPL
jgi:murein DD-endopeptidase MepM/ murein hydrolase activator NlpD